MQLTIPSRAMGFGFTRFSPGDSDLRILYLANLLPEKGCFDVLAALRVLGAETCGWEVRLAGPASPEVERRLRDEIVGLPPGSARVTLVGEAFGAAKVEQYRWANVFPTRYPPEGQPLGVLEALGAGLPVVATWWASIPETIEDEREGILVPPGDDRALAAALQRLAPDPALRARLGSKARSRYEACYTPDHFERNLRTLLADARGDRLALHDGGG